MAAMEDHLLRCAEVYGGNRPVDHAVVLPGLDVWLFSRPEGGAAEGGDLVFVTVCQRGAVSKAFLGDVAGHGATVAPAARDLEALVRRHLHDEDHQDFFGSLNEGVRADLVATAVAVSDDGARSPLLYAYAGHPHLLFRPAGAREFISLEPDYCPIPGKLADLAIGATSGTTYFQSGVPFAVGDVAVLYSDGFTEALAPDGSRPGVPGLLNVANRCSVQGARAFREDLLRRYREDLGIEKYGDDLSLVVVRRVA